jgi:uncharacterized protein YlaN (UPF0358 family)
MWTYSGPSCPDCPSYEELSTTEMDAQIHKILDFGIVLTSGVDPAPL